MFASARRQKLGKKNSLSYVFGLHKSSKTLNLQNSPSCVPNGSETGWPHELVGSSHHGVLPRPGETGPRSCTTRPPRPSSVDKISVSGEADARKQQRLRHCSSRLDLLDMLTGNSRHIIPPLQFASFYFYSSVSITNNIQTRKAVVEMTTDKGKICVKIAR